MNCPVCLNPAPTSGALKGTDVRFETTPRLFELSGCGECHSLFIVPAPGPEEIAGFYPAQYWWNASPGVLKSLESVYRRLVLKDHVSFILKSARSLPPGDDPLRLLDVGCGSATLLALLKLRGLSVQGFDASEHAAQIAQSEHGIRVRVGHFLRDAGFAQNSFDVVTLFHVLEHVTNPRELLRDACRLLKPDGRIVLQVPNIESWQFRLLGKRWYGLDIPRHVIDYSYRSIQRLLKECGLRIFRTRHFNLRDNAPALASSLMPSLDPARRNLRQRQRNKTETPVLSWFRDFLYFGLVVSAVPFAIAESAVGAGATIMIEAGRR